MQELDRCEGCGGFLPAMQPVCPNCDAPTARIDRWARRGRALLAATGSGAVAMTLMACYGPPPEDMRSVEPDPANDPVESKAPPSGHTQQPPPAKAEPSGEPANDESAHGDEPRPSADEAESSKPSASDDP